MSNTDEPPDRSNIALEVTEVATPATGGEGGASRAGARLERGAMLGRYRIAEFVGGGGMGWVYRARDTELERDVAIKVLRPGLAGAKGRERLLAEARAMAKLQHRAVVPVYDVGEHGDGVYVAMALVTGGTLHDWIHARPRPWREVVAKFVEAGRGLEAAHAAGLVHRDFKPRNVLLGGKGEVQVADFGIASASVTADGEPDAHGERPEASTIVGTPAYMAPEQASGKAVDARADQFSFCVSLWEGLHGQRPQEAETRTQGGVIDRATDAPRTRRRVPGWLTTAVARGFAPAPERRWPTMQALLDALERGLGRRRRVLVGAASVVAVAVIVLAYTRARPAQSDPCPPPRGVTWAPADRLAIEAAFRKTGIPFSEDTLGRVMPALDRYVGGWRGRMNDACLATNVRHTQSQEMFDRRLLCLESRRAGLVALLGSFGAADRTVVTNAISAVEGLLPLEDCDRLDALLARPLPPLQARAEVTQIYEQLAQGRTLAQRGRVLDAADLLDRLVVRARSLGWAPALADTLAQLVSIRTVLLQQDKALLDELTLASARAKDDALSLLALTALHRYHVTRGQLEPAAALEPIITATMARVDGHSDMKAEAFVGMAARARAIGDASTAAGLLDAADSRESPGVVRGTVLVERALEQRDPHVAATMFEQAATEFRAHYGDAHPEVARAIVDQGVMLLRYGDLKGAEASWQSARAILEPVFGGSDSPFLADYLQLGGLIAQARGRRAEAVALLERALASYKLQGASIVEAQTERNLANLLSENPSGIPAARGHYQRALERARALQGDDSVLFGEIEASYGIFLASGSCVEAMPVLLHARILLTSVRHPLLIGLLGQLGDCTAAQDPAAAASYYEAAVSTCRDRACAPGMVAQLELATGRLRGADPSRRAEAIALLRKARADFGQIGDVESVTEVDVALKQLGAGPSRAR